MAEHKAQRQAPKGAELARPRRLRKRRRSDRDESLPAASLANTNPARPDQGMLVQLQSQVGNRAVTRLLHPPAAAVLQRDPEGDVGVPGIGAPLVGLKRGDGLDYGTEAARPRVQLLQQKLNEKMLANIKVDGQFGSLTEQSLREFQESEALVPGPVIDSPTADLLMMDRRPGRAPETPPAPSSPGLEDKMLELSGDVLGDSALSISNSGFDLCMAGTGLFDLEVPTKTDAGYRLQEAGLRFSDVAAALTLAARCMQTSQEGSGKIPAGGGLQQAGASLAESGTDTWVAGEKLTGVPEAATSEAGVQLMECSTSLQAGSGILVSAGVKLGLGGGESVPTGAIGDPLVGLQRGDGLNFGTWHRRERVSLLQERLNERLGAGLNPDGMFGPQTGKALTDFQLGAGLPPQERVDRSTAQALRSTNAQPSSGEPSGTGVEGAGRDLAEAGKYLVEASLSLLVAGSMLLRAPDCASAGNCLVASSADLQQAGDAMVIAGTILAPVQP